MREGSRQTGREGKGNPVLNYRLSLIIADILPFYRCITELAPPKPACTETAQHQPAQCRL